MRPQSLVWAICIASAYMVLDGSLAAFYIIAHMVNRLRDVKEYLDLGANALEADLRFNYDGKPEYFYHGDPCDCNRFCDNMEDFDVYMTGLRNLTLADNLAYLMKLRLLMLDLKIGRFKHRQWYIDAGVYLVDGILETLWKNVDPYLAVFVILSVPETKLMDVFRGAVSAINKGAANKYIAKLGFAIDDFSKGAKYVQDGFWFSMVYDRRWVGTGITNCFPYWAKKEEEDLLTFRHRKGGFKVDGAFHWTVDAASSIQSVMKKRYDAVITNRPDIARYVAFKNNVTLAGFFDRPWGYSNY